MENGIGRRRWLRAMAAMGAAGASGYLARALAAGDLPPGLHRVDGKVTVNGKEAKSGSHVAMGDKIATGPGSTAVVVLKGDAFLMRGDTIIEVRGSSGLMSDMIVGAGRVLSVFSKKNVAVRAGTATIGIRGTGAYLEVLPEEIYFCLCYGEAILAGPKLAEQTVVTKHHEQPLLLREAGGTLRVEPGGVRNHTDDELVMLEKLVGREPPFMKDGQSPQNRY